eukprot:scaffold230106_cov14-Prasinocladus_malaysianus.AAC.1
MDGWKVDELEVVIGHQVLLSTLSDGEQAFRKCILQYDKIIDSVYTYISPTCLGTCHPCYIPQQFNK